MKISMPFLRRLFTLSIVAFTVHAVEPKGAEPATKATSNPTIYPAVMLTAAQATADVAMMRRALEEAHPGLYRYIPKSSIDGAFQRLEQRAAQPISDVALYGEISLLLGTIRCDHTKAEFSEALTQYRQENPSHLPFRFKLFDGRMFVFSSDPAQPALKRGTEILSINGVLIGEIINRLLPAISVDGFTDPSRLTKLEADSDLMGSDFDQFYPVFFGFTPTYQLTLRPPSATANKTVTLNAIPFKNWINLAWPAATHRGEFYKSVSFKMAGNSAFLKVDTFVNYRNPVDVDAFYGAFFKSMKERKTEYLILDLRENGGGSSDATLGLATYLLDKPFVWNKPIWQKAIRFGDWTKQVQTWGDPKEIFEPPVENFTQRADGWFEHITGSNTPEQLPMAVSPDRFTGKVLVLTSPINGSGSTMLIAKLKDAKRITTVGVATGGSAEGPTAGRLFFLKLPASGIVVRIANYWNRMNIDTFVQGKGVAADVEIRPTLADFLAGKDTVMDAAGKLQTL